LGVAGYRKEEVEKAGGLPTNDCSGRLCALPLNQWISTNDHLSSVATKSHERGIPISFRAFLQSIITMFRVAFASIYYSSNWNNPTMD
jgi:hypothetical protein